jgi:protein-disulfide isomerase
MDQLKSTPAWVLPVAIIAAGIIVSIALYYVRVHSEVEKVAGNPSVVRPVTPQDHLMGNPTAKVMVVEYGDIDSEHTKDFNAIMQQIMTEYADSGEVAWVFRHLPIVALHQYSAMHASAAECVSSIAGPQAFWGFLNAIAAQAPGTNQFDPRDYETITRGLNVPTDVFNKCIASGTFEQRVQDDYQNAMLAGATGAPYLVLVVKGKEPITIDGALPYTSMKKVLEEAIRRAES